MAISSLSPTTISDPGNPSAVLPSRTPASAAPAPTASGSALNKLANDFDSFLLLLTTQLQNQDPLKPMDSQEFTSQLVQFTSVEQSIQTNKNLEKLISLTGGNSSSTAFNYIGREVRTSSDSTNLSNGMAKWSYELDTSAASSAITVLDAKGNAVFTKEGASGAGIHNFTWDGRDKNGTPFPDGVYRLSVSAVSADQKPVSAKIFTTGTVTNVEISGDTPSLLIGNVKVPLDKVLSVMQGGNAGSALDYIGREIRTISPNTNLSNGVANWTYEADAKAIRTLITIKNDRGQVLLEQEGNTGAGLHNINWNGLDADGDQQPDGVYSASVTGFDNNDAPVTTKVFTSGLVSSVDSSGSEPVLVIGGVKISLRDVLTVTQPSSTASLAP
jgi:flagellar basal-body rod modification protein FlgD